MTEVLVLADAKAEYLKDLQQLVGRVNLTISDQLPLLQEASAKADVVLFTTGPDLLKSILPRATRLRWIHSLYAGVENIVFPELVAHPAIFTNARGLYREPLAEFVMAGALFFTKHFRRLMQNQEKEFWDQFEVDPIRGKVMGIVGYGETGRSCAKLAHAFGMKVVALRRRPELSHGDPLIEKSFGPDGLVEMMQGCDFIILTAAVTPETRRMIGEVAIQAMKSQAVLINVGRGALVDEPALIRALEQGRIRGAALDVFEVEPLPAGHAFFRLKNVLLSPHSADWIPGWRNHSLQLFMRNLENFVNGQPLENIVDKHAGY
jgi:phosphoglycerate dehydrogenase-like enzyme